MRKFLKKKATLKNAENFSTVSIHDDMKIRPDISADLEKHLILHKVAICIGF